MLSRIKHKIKELWDVFGVGIVVAGSDDDDSGILTYSQAGAHYKYKMLWSMLLTIPLMASIQEISGRIGLVTKKGLIAVLKEHYPKSVLYSISMITTAGIILNISADIFSVGSIMNMLIPQIKTMYWSIIFVFMMIFALIFWSYKTISNILKWLAFTLFVYLMIPFLLKLDWNEIIIATLCPQIEFTREYFMVLVGVLGTTISTYCFVYQASATRDERIEKKYVRITKKRLFNMRLDNNLAMTFSNLISWGIIVTCGSTLYPNGIKNIETLNQAAESLRPIAGEYSFWLFAFGAIGVSFLAIPVLASAVSFIFADLFNLPQGFGKTFNEAPTFYLVISISMLASLVLPFFGISVVDSLLWSAVLYGITASPVIFFILHIANSKEIMGEYINGWLSNTLGWLTFILMLLSTLSLLYYTFISP